jgi:hypothetical protein
MSENKPHPLALPHWGGIAAIAGIVGTIVTILALIVTIWTLPPPENKEDKKPNDSTSTNPSESILQASPQQPILSTPSFIVVGQPKPTTIEVELQPRSDDAITSIDFRKKLNKAVDTIAPKIKACFSDYRASYKFDVAIGVNVTYSSDGNYVPSNEITFIDTEAMSEEDKKHAKDVIMEASSTFPSPKEYSTQFRAASYDFYITVTFVPEGS